MITLVVFVVVPANSSSCLSLPELAAVFAEDIKLIQIDLILNILTFATFIVLVDQDRISEVRALGPATMVWPTFAYFGIIWTMVSLNIPSVVTISIRIGRRLLSRHTFTHF